MIPEFVAQHVGHALANLFGGPAYEAYETVAQVPSNPPAEVNEVDGIPFVQQPVTKPTCPTATQLPDEAPMPAVLPLCATCGDPNTSHQPWCALCRLGMIPRAR